VQGNELPVSPALIVGLFLLVFPLFWIAVIGLIANFGWRGVASFYPATSDPPFSARRVRFASLSLGSSFMSPQYGSSINAWLSEAGMWLRPVLPFRPFHPMIYVPWARTRSIESERFLFTNRVRIRMLDDMPDLLLRGALGRAALEAAPSGRRGGAAEG
jgi:hypothetical protein